ncbi:hypothetical protein WMY93_008910 [Mugilogobius chulae]|uniref:RRM domain-containing protein n=1 Tax=Mugilogobius chulae TaxID=88201 RepID=A0AAW0P9Y3_9GOBI
MEEDQEAIDSIRRFHTLHETKWSELVSHSALSNLSEAKYNKADRLPLARDVQKLQSYLGQQVESAGEKLGDNPTAGTYAALAKVILCQVILFNRRREGEVARMTVKNFEDRDMSKLNDDISSGLTEVEKRLCQQFARVELKGKKGRKVAVILTSDMTNNLSLLISKRKECGVTENNKYLFAIPCSDGHYRGQFGQFADACGAEHPQNLRSTNLRKQIATISQVMNLKDNELDQLADFLGHDIRVHREYYRLPQSTIQLAKISKLLMAMEKGSVKDIQGKSLDEIGDDQGNDGCVTSPPVPDSVTKGLRVSSRRGVKRPWSEEEIRAVMKHMKPFIENDHESRTRPSPSNLKIKTKWCGAPLIREYYPACPTAIAYVSILSPPSSPPPGHTLFSWDFHRAERGLELNTIYFEPNVGLMPEFGPMNPLMPGLGLVPDVPVVKEIIHCKSCTLFPPNPNLPPPATRERPPGCKTVFVGGLPENSTEQTIEEVFGPCGAIIAIRKSKKNFCHIRFAEEFTVDKALFLSDDANFAEAVRVLLTWLERGEVNRRNANNFYSMIQSSNSHIRRLMNEKAQHEKEMEEAKERFKSSLAGILGQFEQIVSVFQAASKQKAWDHFTKAQRKNLDTWRKQVQEIRNMHNEQLMGIRREEEMEMSDDDMEVPPSSKLCEDSVASQAEALKEENDSLRCQLDAYRNEVELLKQEQNKNQPQRSEEENTHSQQLSFLQQALQACKRIICTFLHVHPFGASLEYICSYLQRLDSKISTSEVEALLTRLPCTFRQELSGVGASLEKRWNFCGFLGIKSI